MIPKRLNYEDLTVSIAAHFDPALNPGMLFLSLTRKIDEIPFHCRYAISQDALKMNKKEFEEFSSIMHHICKDLSMEMAYFIQNKLQSN